MTSGALLLFYPVVGLLTGVVAGLFGFGGGILIVPVLSVLLPLQGLPSQFTMQSAVATSLAIVIVTSMSALIAHNRQQLIVWDVLRKIWPGTLLGGFIGALLATHLHGRTLEVLFGLFLVLIALHLLMQTNTTDSRHLPGRRALILISTLIAMLCSMLGLSGGSLLVPFLKRYQIAFRNAVATATACNILVACTGVITFIAISAIQQLQFRWGQTGFVNWLAFLGIAMTSVLAAPLGVKLASILSPQRLQRYFALLLLIVGLKMLLPY